MQPANVSRGVTILILKKSHSLSTEHCVTANANKHFLQLQLHFKSIQLVKHKSAFNLKYASHRKCNVFIDFTVREHCYKRLWE